MIYTGCYDDLQYLDNRDIVPISIAGRCRDDYSGAEYKVLAPKKWFFLKWKENNDNEYYIKNFYKYVLDPLNPSDIVKRLYEISNKKDVILLCWEPDGLFCHRHLVAEWLRINGYKVEKWKADVIIH